MRVYYFRGDGTLGFFFAENVIMRLRYGSVRSVKTQPCFSNVLYSFQNSPIINIKHTIQNLLTLLGFPFINKTGYNIDRRKIVISTFLYMASKLITCHKFVFNLLNQHLFAKIICRGASRNFMFTKVISKGSSRNFMFAKVISKGSSRNFMFAKKAN